MVIVAYFDLELYHMDVKTTILNNDMLEIVHLKQLDDF